MAGCLALPVECASGITPLLEWVQSFSRASPLVTMWSFGLRVLCRMTFPAEALPPGTQLASLVINSYLEKRRAAQVDEAADLYDCWRRNSPEARRGGASQGDNCGVFGCSSREERMSSRTRPSKRRGGCAGRSAKTRPFSSARNLALPATGSFCWNSRSVTGIKTSCMGLWMLTTR